MSNRKTKLTITREPDQSCLVLFFRSDEDTKRNDIEVMRDLINQLADTPWYQALIPDPAKVDALQAEFEHYVRKIRHYALPAGIYSVKLWYEFLEYRIKEKKS